MKFLDAVLREGEQDWQAGPEEWRVQDFPYRIKALRDSFGRACADGSVWLTEQDRTSSGDGTPTTRTITEYRRFTLREKKAR